MPRTTISDLESILADIKAQLHALAERVETIEGAKREAAAAAAQTVAPPQPVQEQRAVEEAIPEEDLMAISAALAAYFGVRVRARQIRLISSPAWAQQGRVSVQASHALMH
jgi:methylmalonyl-CoA carboxyltransferase 12S subunit